MPKTLQSALGELKPYRIQRFDHFKVAVVASTSHFDEDGTIEVHFVRGGHPVPVHIFENMGTNLPEEGDWVLIGFAEGSKHFPFLIGYLKDYYRTSDILRLTKNFFEVKFPIEYDPDSHEKEFGHVMLVITHPADEDDDTEERIFLQIPGSVDEDHHTFFEMTDGRMDLATGNRDTYLSEDDKTEIEGEVDYHVHKEVTVQIDDDTHITIDGDKNVSITGDWNINVDGDTILNVAGDVICQSGGDVVVEAASNVAVTAGGAVSVEAPNVNVEAATVNIEAGVINADGGIVNLAGGGPGVARAGDPVSITIPSGTAAGTYAGTITSGSGTVLAAD